LDLSVGTKDKCPRCNCLFPGLRLSGPANRYHYASYGYHPAALPLLNFLPGLLKEDRSVQSNTKEVHRHNTMFPDIFQEMLNDEAGPAPEDIKFRDCWLCVEYIQSLFRRHFYHWLLRWKKSRYQVIHKDCGNGWDCTGQANVKKCMFNHLCEPSNAVDR